MTDRQTSRQTDTYRSCWRDWKIRERGEETRTSRQTDAGRQTDLDLEEEM